jgi:hypothetical protein
VVVGNPAADPAHRVLDLEVLSHHRHCWRIQ